MLATILVVLSAFGQKASDAKCISIMGAPLEGPDSVFIPILEEVGFTQIHPAEEEADTYYFEGDYSSQT